MDEFSYSLFYGSCMILAMLCTFHFYNKVFSKIRRSKAVQRMINGGEVAAGNGAQENAIGGGMDFHTLKKEMRLVKTSFKIFLLFVCLWSPTAGLILLGPNRFIPKPIYLYSLFFAHSNSTLNFFIYYVDNVEFRNGFWRLVSKCFCHKQNHDEPKIFTLVRLPATVGNNQVRN